MVGPLNFRVYPVTERQTLKRVCDSTAVGTHVVRNCVWTAVGTQSLQPRSELSSEQANQWSFKTLKNLGFKKLSFQYYFGIKKCNFWSKSKSGTSWAPKHNEMKLPFFGLRRKRACDSTAVGTQSPWAAQCHGCVATALASQQLCDAPCRRSMRRNRGWVAASLFVAAPCVATAVGSQQAFCWHFIGFTNMSEIDGAVAAASSLVNKKMSLVLINFHGCFWKCSWSLMILCFFWRIKLRKVAPPCPTPLLNDAKNIIKPVWN